MKISGIILNIVDKLENLSYSVNLFLSKIRGFASDFLVSFW